MKRIHSFPPYGALARPYAQQISDPVAPIDFSTHGGDRDEWLKWIEETVALINSCLWPSWNYREQCWISQSIEMMNDLTLADFSILRGFLESNYLESTLPLSVVAWRARHLEFFLDEDQDRIGRRLGEYSSELPASVIPYDRWIAEIFRTKIGYTSMHLKYHLQRPRAYQVATLVGADWFTWNLGATSMSPSMSSGHALQGLLLAAGTFEGLLQKGVALSSEAKVGLAQFGVDIGDRRVFAGIHYPSDNIASWIAVGRLAKKVFHRRETREFIHFAVTERSEVYKRVAGALSQHPVLIPSLSALDGALLLD